VEAGLVLAEAGAHAAIDLSDGLLADLGHLCEASGVGAEVGRDRLPRTSGVARLDAEGADFAATGGEDYELLAACPSNVTADLASLAARANVALTVIGRCTDRIDEITLLDADRRPMPLPAGFDHFSRPVREG
jgi:thiamine-monophosphate kinase